MNSELKLLIDIDTTITDTIMSECKYRVKRPLISTLSFIALVKLNNYIKTIL